MASTRRPVDDSRKTVDEFPKIDGSGTKCTLRLSATTVMRRREPTSKEQIVSNLPNMVWHYSDQREVWPNGNPNALIEASQKTGHAYSTMNKSGHPFALGHIDVGGSPDVTGKPIWHKATPKKMLK